MRMKLPVVAQLATDRSWPGTAGSDVRRIAAVR